MLIYQQAIYINGKACRLSLGVWNRNMKKIFLKYSLASADVDSKEEKIIINIETFFAKNN